ncbi:hypothetical protein CDL12_14613 [Handroanthus impetiginosus]|uniref:RNase H type-1 domain-containing protein n=1 Tax=Handroanthus impetiginosus TaxID=429701 RepID=A0A2G9H637_9LAMI|nr:hypothetical protein CDL12_14613 [Handroanthus impetiginosus]
MVVDKKQLRLKVYEDCKLVVNQLLGRYKIKDLKTEHVPRVENKQANELAKVACTLAMLEKEALEAIPLKELKKENVFDCIRLNIIYRYGISQYIIIDSKKYFCNNVIEKLCQKFSFKQRKFSMYYYAANSFAKAFNKTLCTMLKKIVAKSKRDWHERIRKISWPYRTTSIQEKPTKEKNARPRLEELEAFNEKR